MVDDDLVKFQVVAGVVTAGLVSIFCFRRVSLFRLIPVVGGHVIECQSEIFLS